MAYPHLPDACRAGATAAKSDRAVENVPCNSTTGRCADRHAGSLTPARPTDGSPVGTEPAATGGLGAMEPMLGAVAPVLGAVAPVPGAPLVCVGAPEVHPTSVTIPISTAPSPPVAAG